MKKDIEIPQVENVYVAAVREFNEEFQTDEWNVYLINSSDKRALEMVLIVSKGFDDKRETSVMRHRMEKLPPKSFAKIEFLQDEVLELTNEFRISYFDDSKMFDKKFIFPKNSIQEEALTEIPVIPKKGILAK